MLDDGAAATVVVPTKNEAQNIVPFLASLPPDIELIVVDSSDDETAALIAALRPAHTRIITAQVNIPTARQMGAEAARTPWVVFTDADVVFTHDYFERLRTYSQVHALYGLKQSADGYPHYYRWFTSGQRVLDWCGVPAVSGSNFVVRRDVLMAVGGFDVALSCNEDSELGWRIARSGYTIRLATDLVVFARDQRRLERGATRKMLHSLVRCTLLYTGLMPKKWRSSDWGYWADA